MIERRRQSESEGQEQRSVHVSEGGGVGNYTSRLKLCPSFSKSAMRFADISST